MLPKTKKPLGLAIQIFSKLALGLACLSLIPVLNTSIPTQAAPVYSCPAGQVLEGNQCATYKCLDGSNADANGNCSIGQMSLFECNGTGTQVMFKIANNNYPNGLCTNRPDLFVRAGCSNLASLYNETVLNSPAGTITTDTLQRPGTSFTQQLNQPYQVLHGGGRIRPVIDNNGGPDYEFIVNNFKDDNLQNNMCATVKLNSFTDFGRSFSATYERLPNQRACPAGFGVFMIPTSIKHYIPSTPYDSNNSMPMVCANYSVNSTGLRSIAWSNGYRPQTCQTFGMAEIYSVDLSWGDGESSALCGPSSPQPASQIGYKTLAAATISSYTIESSNVGTGTCGTNNTVIQGATTTCTFALTGAPNGVYTIPAAGLLGAILQTNDVASNYGTSSACTVAGSVLTCSNIPVANNATVGAHEVVILEPNVSWYRNKGSVNVAENITEITNSNTGAGTCVPSEILIGGSVTCSYPLNGNFNNKYKLPASGITANISTVIGNSSPCQIVNDGTVNAALVCANVPSLGGSIGNQTSKLNLTGQTKSAPVRLFGTLITANNTGNGKCTPLTITIGNLALCDYALSGSSDNIYILPMSGIKTKITTANSSSNPCQISNNGTATASITCTQVPTSGATPGTQTASLNLPNETNSVSVTLLASTTTLGTNPQGELTGKVGSPVTGFITTTGSTYSGPATYTNGNNCNIPGVVSLGIFSPIQGALVPITCPTGNLSNGVITAVGNVDLGGVKSNFAKTEVTIDDLNTIKIICNDGKAVTTGSTTTCTFQLPENKILPKDLFFGIGDAKPAGTCTVKDNMVTCINIPTGSKSGIQPLNSQINGGSIFDTGKKITVNPKIVLVRTGNNTTIFFALLALVATTFSFSIAGRLELARQRK